MKKSYLVQISYIKQFNTNSFKQKTAFNINNIIMYWVCAVIKYKHLSTYNIYIITPRDHISQDLSYFSGPKTSGATKNNITRIIKNDLYLFFPVNKNKCYVKKQYLYEHCIFVDIDLAGA